MGVSGGVDSTMLAYTVKRKLGLRPLAVHIDNGWNAELAVSNIEKVLKIMDVDLYTHVLDWEEFKDLQLSFLKASVINTEIPSDHAFLAGLYMVASKMNIQYVLWGSNIVSEAIIPRAWIDDFMDWKFIKGIQKTHGKIKLKHFPHLSLLRTFYYIFIKRIKFISLFNYIKYNKSEAIAVIENELGWTKYGGSIMIQFIRGSINRIYSLLNLMWTKGRLIYQP